MRRARQACSRADLIELHLREWAHIKADLGPLPEATQWHTLKGQAVAAVGHRSPTPRYRRLSA